MIRYILMLSVLGAVLYVGFLPVPADIEVPWKLKLSTLDLLSIGFIWLSSQLTIVNHGSY